VYTVTYVAHSRLRTIQLTAHRPNPDPTRRALIRPNRVGSGLVGVPSAAALYGQEVE